MRPSTHVLATDLDGTLIPLPDSHENREDLQTLTRALQACRVQLVFVTGRHLASVEKAMHTYRLPVPQWIICDVGTSIYRHHGPDRLEPMHAYCEHLDELVAHMPLEQLAEALPPPADMVLQEPEKQGRFKRSYYCAGERLQDCVHALQQSLERLQAPYSVIGSIDPFDQRGLVDVLPAGVSKASALAWWTRHVEFSFEELVFAGDSGNDLAAFLAGFRCIVVGNAPAELVTLVQREHRLRQWRDRLFHSTRSATSGVLEGCCWFGLFEQC